MKRCLCLLLLASCAPPWPADAALTTGRVTGNSVELVWPAATRDVDAYRVSRGAQVLARALAGNATSFVVGGLDDGERYSFAVQACAPDGRCSAGLTLEVVTPDVTPPKWKQPPRFAVVVESETETSARLRLSWTEVHDNLGVHEFVLRHQPEEPVTVAGTEREHVLESAFPDGIWEVVARDRAGNASESVGFKVETELTPVRREAFKARGMAVLAERGRGSDATMFGPDGVGVVIDRPAATGGGTAPVWLGDGGRDEARAWVVNRMRALEACYQRARQDDAALAGLLTATLAIDANGEVNPSRMDGIKHAGLRGCVRGALRGRLPAAPSAAYRTDIPIHMNVKRSD